MMNGKNEKRGFSLDIRRLGIFWKALLTMVMLVVFYLEYEILKTMDSRTLVFIGTLCFVLYGTIVWTTQVLKDYGMIKYDTAKGGGDEE